MSGTLIYVRQTVGERYECPHCGHITELINWDYTTADTKELGEIVECESCDQEYELTKEDFEED